MWARRLICLIDWLVGGYRRSFRFNLSHIKFFVTQWVPELLTHSKAQDESQVREHYDRGSTL